MPDGFMTPDRRFSESVIQSGPDVDSEVAFLCLVKPRQVQDPLWANSGTGAGILLNILSQS